jgi:multiple sugar transport system ATP-binding protein
VLPADVFAGAPARAVQIGLRPEQILQGEGEDSFVQRVEHLGDQTRLHLTFRTQNLITVTEAHTTLKEGDIVKIRPNKPFYFDATGARLV